MFCIAHTCIRNAFDKQFHFNSTAYCLSLTLAIIWFAIPITTSLTASLLGSIPIAFLICFFGFIAQDRVDLLIEVKRLENYANELLLNLNHKDIYTMNEDELYEHCRNCGYMPYPPYMMDYASQGGEYLSDRDLQMWADKLMKKVEDKDKQFLSRENIRKRADEMGIKFEKYSFEEFYVVVLMKYTDHCKTLGTANMDIYLKLAKDFLEDEDSSLKYGERLAAYYDFVING